LELEFQHALASVGIFLVIVGLAAAIASAPSSLQESDSVLDALAYGFTAIFFALFSGVLIGVGAALILTALVLRLRRGLTHITMSVLLSLLSALIAVAAVAPAKGQSYPTIVLFFAGLASAGAFLMAAVAFALSDAVKNFLRTYKGG